MNETKLNQFIDISLVAEQVILNGTYFLFHALPADIESIRVIETSNPMVL
jgi:hypothetical protein